MVTISYFINHFADFFELPAEIMLDLPLMMVVGQHQLYLENHSGLALYREDLIRVRVKSCLLSINGEKLKIEEITPDHLLISGDISGTNYEFGGRTP